jgi:hypothetical protein
VNATSGWTRRAAAFHLTFAVRRHHAGCTFEPDCAHMKHRLDVTTFAQIAHADVEFGDLTVLVGPQATGKSLMLQLLKLAVDAGSIASTLHRQGFSWDDREEFCAVYFGEGMAKAWSDATVVRFNGRDIIVPPRRLSAAPPRLFYIPAHRTLSVAEGWPAGFRSYKPDTPFIVREFSERLLELLTTSRAGGGNVLFPQDRRLQQQFQRLIDDAVFHGGELQLISDGPRRQFKIKYPNSEIAYMAWTAGQREFIPLLLGMYFLVPSRRRTKVPDLHWVVIEEPEMGLHAKAVQAVMLLILELMHRGYRVALATHSTAVLEVIWAMQQLKRAKASALREVFGVEEARQDFDALANDVLRKTYKVYVLDYADSSVVARDISALDPGAASTEERSWGGLTQLADRVNDLVARISGD